MAGWRPHKSVRMFKMQGNEVNELDLSMAYRDAKQIDEKSWDWLPKVPRNKSMGLTSVSGEAKQVQLRESRWPCRKGKPSRNPRNRFSWRGSHPSSCSPARIFPCRLATSEQLTHLISPGHQPEKTGRRPHSHRLTISLARNVVLRLGKVICNAYLSLISAKGPRGSFLSSDGPVLSAYSEI
jgi:hypothetical protein